MLLPIGELANQSSIDKMSRNRSGDIRKAENGPQNSFYFVQKPAKNESIGLLLSPHPKLGYKREIRQNSFLLYGKVHERKAEIWRISAFCGVR